MQNPAELLRLINNMIRVGTVAEIRYGTPGEKLPTVRIQHGDLLTNWITWSERRTGTTRTWSPPTLGEQVIIMSPDGDPNTGFIMSGLFSEHHVAPSDHGDHYHAVMPDGAVIDYNHVKHHLDVYIPGTIRVFSADDITVETPAHVTVTAGDGATINADTVINGKLTINGPQVTHNGKNIGDTHVHGGVTSGGSTTSVPA